MIKLVSTFNALLQASDQLELDTPSQQLRNTIIEAGVVRPLDTETLNFWFGRYLSIRQELWSLINGCIDAGNRVAHGLSDEQVWSHFIVGYSAACLLIRNDQSFLFDVAKHSVMQRQFNEAVPEYRIPRKQYTRIFSAFVDGADALRIYEAIHDAKRNRAMLDTLCTNPDVGELAQQLPTFEQWLTPSKRTYFQRLASYLSHKWRRKSVVTLNNMLSRAVEKVGRTASEIQLPLEKRVSVERRNSMLDFLQPGDVLITRHDAALTNLFLPGFWPHAALYVGTEAQREVLGVNVDTHIASKWAGDKCVFEALKDGVRFRPITQTLAVDNFVVLRPTLSASEIRAGIERVVVHEGKLYNYDFDFFGSEKLVCSEVVYRAYDGLGDLSFPLIERAGRHTLSPEDIVDLAINGNGLSVVGIYGFGASRETLVTGQKARQLVVHSVSDDASDTNA